jgi:tryptophan synthase beta subunit
MKLARKTGMRKDIVVTLSGRGDKDIEEVMRFTKFKR